MVDPGYGWNPRKITSNHLHLFLILTWTSPVFGVISSNPRELLGRRLLLHKIIRVPTPRALTCLLMHMHKSFTHPTSNNSRNGVNPSKVENLGHHEPEVVPHPAPMPTFMPTIFLLLQINTAQIPTFRMPRAKRGFMRVSMKSMIITGVALLAPGVWYRSMGSNVRKVLRKKVK